MKIEFFKPHSEYIDLRKNGSSKIFAGLFLISIGLFIFFAEPSYITSGDYYVGGFAFSGKAYNGLITLLYLTFGKWNSSAIFYALGLVFIIWGTKDLIKNNVS